MPHPSSSPLENIISVTDELLKFLAPRASKNTDPKEAINVRTIPLHLPDVDSQSLQQALSKRNLSTPLISDVLRFAKARTGDLKGSYLSHWERFFTAHPSSMEKNNIMIFARSLQNKFLADCTALNTAIVDVLDNRLNKFRCDAEAAAKSDYESSSEDGLPNNRGHSRLAVAILEKAYSHTTNITRAEKVRLAAATKLEPRQVTIWFQNRRNRKVAAPTTRPIPGTPNAKALESCQSSSVTPTQNQIRRNKRKAEVGDDEEMLPLQRMRTSTPDKSPLSSSNMSLNDSSGTPSMISSIDSLASWSRGMSAKDRNYSSDSSVMGGGEQTSIYSSAEWKGRTPTAMSFDEQVQRQLGPYVTTYYREDDISSSLLFSDTGAAQLDLEDLGIDLNTLVEELPSFSNDAFDFSMPTPSAQAVGRFIGQFDFDFQQKTPRQTAFAIPDLPTTPEEAADQLSLSPIDASEEVIRVQKSEKWAMGSGGLLQEDHEDEWFLSLEGLTWGSSSSSTTTPSNDSMSGNGSNVATPPDIFDFSLGGLAITHIMDEILSRFRV